MSGSSLSATEYVAAPKSAVMVGTSSSVIDTRDVALVPVVMRFGSVTANPRLTFTSSSSTLSCVAVKVNDLLVCVALNCRFAGTPE